MKQLSSNRLILLGTVLAAIGAATMLVAAAQAKVSSTSRVRASGTVVALRKTAIGTILVDSHGRTLYLFEKDRNALSRCNAACVSYWPLLTATRRLAPGRACISRCSGSAERTTECAK